MAFTYYGSGDFITVEVAASKSATAGKLAEMTDDYTARDNETANSSQVVGAFVTDASAGEKVAVCTKGVVNLAVDSSNSTTAGKTVLAGTNTKTGVEDGTTAGDVVGRALQTSAASGTCDVLLGHC